MKGNVEVYVKTIAAVSTIPIQNSNLKTFSAVFYVLSIFV